MAIYGLCECLGVSASCVAERSLSNRAIELRLLAASRHAYDVPGGAGQAVNAMLTVGGSTCVTYISCDHLQETRHHVVGMGFTQAKSQWFCCHCFHFVRDCLRRTEVSADSVTSCHTKCIQPWRMTGHVHQRYFFLSSTSEQSP